MLFNSIEFLLFFAIFIAIWPLLRRRRNLRWIYLVVASFFFYGWWDWRFLFLIIGSGLIDFFAGLGMARFPVRRKLLLWASIIGNIGSLAMFKYFDFFITTLNQAFGLAGAGGTIPLAHLILPVGISFYTFQSMSYTIEVYQGKLKPTRNVFHFFAYLAMFPQLVAGPIVRAAHLLPQLMEVRKTTEAQRWQALRLVVFGYFKKVVVADNIASTINVAFSAPIPVNDCFYWWIIVTLFAFQIYCDFSGYSDIARGLGKWMGFNFPVNFNHPYIATSLRDFWARWHMSLSTWFRDYVYIPLGGSRKGKLRAHLNLWITMILSGLWHGAAWTFVIWGAVHAMYMSIERITNWPKRLCKLRGGRHVAVLLTFLLVLVSWVFFRAESLSQAFTIIGTMFSFHNDEHVSGSLFLLSTAGFLVGSMILRQMFFHFRLDELKCWRWKAGRILGPVTIAILIIACVYFRGPGNAFVYFQF